MNRYLHTCIIFLVCIGIGLTSCKSRKNTKGLDNSSLDTVKTGPLESEENAETIQKAFSAFENENLSIPFLSAKIKIDIKQEGGNNINLTFNLRLQKDQKIWASIAAFGGIEVARVLVDTDSVKILDRFNNKYIRNDFNYLSDLLGIELNYSLLEALLINNFTSLMPLNTNDISRTTNYIAIQNKGLMVSQYQLLDSTTKKINQYNYNNSVSLQDFQINYSDYRIFEEKLFPYKFAAISTSNGKSTAITGEFIRIQKEDNLEFPFNIPSKFN